MFNLKIHFGKFFLQLMLNIAVLKIVEGQLRPFNNSLKNTNAIIFLHGFEDNVSRWQKVFDDMHLKNTEIIIPITKNVFVKDVKNVPGWFEIEEANDIQGEDEDENGILKSMNFIERLIHKQLKRGIRSPNILVGGFHQGGSIALMTGLKCKKKLAGIFALSTWLPRYYDEKIDKTKIVKNYNISILVCHGAKDQVVPIKYGEEIAERLKNETSNVLFKLYDNLGHDITSDEINDIRDFILSRLNNTQT